MAIISNPDLHEYHKSHIMCFGEIVIVFINDEGVKYVDLDNIIEINSIDKKYADKKYKKYEAEIKKIYWEKNDFNGYNSYHLISPDTASEILSISHCTVSKLRGNHLIKLINDLDNVTPIITEEALVTDPIPEETPPLKSEKPLSDDKHSLAVKLYGGISWIKALIDKRINYCDYADDKNVMYFVLLDLHDTDIICKVGYTSSIVNRLTGLAEEYRCGVTILDLKSIESESIEKNFHKMYTAKYPEDKFEHKKIGGTSATEVYYARERLYKAFLEVPVRPPFCNHSFGFTVSEEINKLKASGLCTETATRLAERQMELRGERNRIDGIAEQKKIDAEVVRQKEETERMRITAEIEIKKMQLEELKIALEEKKLALKEKIRIDDS